MIDFGTSQSPKSTRPLTTYWCPSRPGHQALRNNFASSLLLRTWLPYDWTPRSEAYFVFPLAQGTPGKQCGLAATGVYQPSLRSPWLAAEVQPQLVRPQGGTAGAIGEQPQLLLLDPVLHFVSAPESTPFFRTPSATDFLLSHHNAGECHGPDRQY
ncbi:hypothetical protein [Thiolapillus sp.]|uniref:hypothetical protein n=1 Tax=Thiolapillus sp. TaxID=2017437 RepID=UPI003AF9E96D